MITRHLWAYRFARDYALGKTVLEIGCGEGYGSHYLAEAAQKITAIDYNQEVIKYAREKYAKDNLRFICLDVKDLNSLGDKFDMICCFQVIEHINDPDAFLAAIPALLNNDGIFICSTPNKLDMSPNSPDPVNKFHVKEYLIREFRELLGRHFNKIEMFGLKRSQRLNFFRRLKKIGIFNFFPDKINPVNKFYSRIDYSNFAVVRDNIDKTLDFIAVCGK
ncbi:MAG: methyltransferase domain-containing protein [Candidatus Omnitrophota bacterium]|nr:methyltransferase domain-containing protein [Candidatus Omnitrophota bacterium]MBU1929443.1 methyltransferase domain-containing protein [Candidatus Omnitrophota bacterium]MBU2258086.1 methyltransferase domain-containing protein [Candidatus Omnitrophota bacterium]